MKNQEYLVRKYNEQGCNYDNRFYNTYAEAWANTTKSDVLIICKVGTVYYASNRQGWAVNAADIIRTVTR